MSEQAFYRWKNQYGGLRGNELRWLKQLEEESRRLKQLVAETLKTRITHSHAGLRIVGPSLKPFSQLVPGILFGFWVKAAPNFVMSSSFTPSLG